jgi:hypothetical protein
MLFIQVDSKLYTIIKVAVGEIIWGKTFKYFFLNILHRFRVTKFLRWFNFIVIIVDFLNLENSF